ncbi:MAG: hypothetical protein UZ14_CFX002001827 [Chloroflexi bacterium OLB14]|nr:MAG: hypothetical protein UZ14_CFX002001827 [Chloroflexi bacterium OLB14]
MLFEGRIETKIISLLSIDGLDMPFATTAQGLFRQAQHKPRPSGLPFTIHYLPFTIHHSPFTIYCS